MPRAYLSSFWILRGGTPSGKKLQDRAEWAHSQLAFMKEKLSAGLEWVNDALAVLEQEVVPIDRVCFLMLLILPKPTMRTDPPLFSCAEFGGVVRQLVAAP
jgi:hypothetical protein